MKTATTSLIILFESELRTAAAALARAVEAEDTEAFPDFAIDALNACIAALHGVAEQPDAHMLLTSTDNLIGSRNKGRARRSREGEA